MHPLNNTSKFKSFIFNSPMSKIFIGFIFLYLLLSIFFSIIYLGVAEVSTYTEILKFSILLSFSFDTGNDIAGNDVFFILNFVHQVLSLVISTIFTAAIVLKFFYLPTFFVFKKKLNFIEGSNELTISLYNGIDLFVTNCNIRIYGRKQSVDKNGKKALENINSNRPIFEKFYPFMEMHLATRLKVVFKEGDLLWKILREKKFKDEKMDLIILIEATAANVDSSIYEVYKYTLDGNKIDTAIDFKGASSIELNYDDFSKSDGWEVFDK